jgi:hypothetical protein
MKTYAEKLRSPKWQKKRLEILDRDGWCCQSCGDKDSNLQVHHKAYKPKTDPWDYPEDWLTTLCEDCHSEISYRLPQLNRLIGKANDASLLTAFVGNCGGVGTPAFNRADDLAAAYHLLDGAVTHSDRVVALKCLQRVRDEINKMEGSILSDES